MPYHKSAETAYETRKKPKLAVYFAYGLIGLSVFATCSFFIGIAGIGKGLDKRSIEQFLNISFSAAVIVLVIAAIIGFTTAYSLLKGLRWGWILSQFLFTFLIFFSLGSLLNIPNLVLQDHPSILILILSILFLLFKMTFAGIGIYYFHQEDKRNYYHIDKEDSIRIYYLCMMLCFIIVGVGFWL